MVEYNARWEEFEKGVIEAEEKDYRQVGDDPAKTLPITTRATLLSKSFSIYMDWRDRTLQEGLKMLEEESTSITGSGQRARWSEHFSKKGQEALKIILDSVKEYDKAPNLRKFGEEAAGQESQFFAQLARAPLAWVQGQLQQYTREFYKEMNNLEGKWRTLGDQDRSIDDKIRETSKKILSIQQDAVNEFISNERGLEDTTKTLVNKLKDAPSGTVPPYIKYPLQVVDWYLERLKALRISTVEYTGKIQENYRYEDTIVVMFTQTREMVREFMDKTNLATAVEEYNESCRNALDMASQCPTSRQRDDAKKFVEKGISKVEKFLNNFKEEYSEFVSDNKGIFVGPVNDKTLEELLEIQERKRTWEEIEHFNIQSKLQDLYKHSITLFEVDVEGLSEEQKKELKDFFK
ncbi:MAG: hypothetical protein QG670_1390, partial [Thermoproteota archaeon]|nr:hypothetical protein [Thermoproteota archaeon]